MLEEKFMDFLNVRNLSVVSNGTLALMLAIKALDIKGEVVTTPYSFVATVNSLAFLNIKPVFIDVDASSGNINPFLIEKAITKNTTAIFPVYVYGNPCDTEKIEKVAQKYNLKVIYDAAHCFDIKHMDRSILESGDISVLSFHATKCFNTLEGGAVICKDITIYEKIEKLKSFGFVDENSVDDIGINAKLNEFQAAFGLFQLEYYQTQKVMRKRKSDLYEKLLYGIKGISFVCNNEWGLAGIQFIKD